MTGTIVGFDGAYDLTTGELEVSVDGATFEVLDLITIDAENLTFTPNAPGAIATIDSTRVTIPGFAVLEEAVIEDIILTRDAISIGAANISLSEAIRGPPGSGSDSLFELNGLQIVASGFSVNLNTGAVTGSLSVSADSAILFPDGNGGGLATAVSHQGVKGIQATLTNGAFFWNRAGSRRMWRK